MKITDLPSLMGTPFATSGTRSAISQDTTAGSNAASYLQGFPDITMETLENGGLPPRGQDFNQILYELSSSARFASTGAMYSYDQTFADAIGGYPSTARVAASDGLVYVSNSDDNAEDPISSTKWDLVTASGESQSILNLNETTFYDVFSASGEFEFADNYQTVTIDKDRNVISYLADGVGYVLVGVKMKTVSADEVLVGGVAVDPNGSLSAADKLNLEALSETTTFSSAGSEFEFNPVVLVVKDDDNNVLFNLEEYIEKKPQWDEAYEKSKDVEPQKVNPLAPFTQVDSAGYSQVRVINTETFEEVAVTSGTSNESEVRPDVLDRIVWKSDRADTAPGGLFYAESPDFVEHSYIARSKIAGWGHSFMDNAAFLNKLAELTGLPTYNFGKASATSVGIAARQGGDPSYYMPVDGTIPASGSVNLTPNVSGPAGNYSNGALSVPPCTLAGVEGTFTWDGTQASFTRTTDGDPVSVPEAVELYVKPITTRAVTNSTDGGIEVPLNDEFINVFWLGRNNIGATDTIIKNAIAMVSYLKNIGKRVVILPDFNAGNEPSGSTGYIQMTTLNAALKAEFPEFYCEIDGVDLRANFIAHGNPDYPTDAAQMALDETPQTLRYDYLHPAQTLTTGASGVSLAPEYALGVGAEINAQFVYDFMKLKGWVN